MTTVILQTNFTVVSDFDETVRIKVEKNGDFVTLTDEIGNSFTLPECHAIGVAHALMSFESFQFDVEDEEVT